MSESSGELPADVKAALQRGDAIDAIMLLREATGLGLGEAKEAIGRYLRGDPAFLASAIAREVSMPPAVAEAMLRGNKLEAIRLLREQTGLGLKEAKDAVEASTPQSPVKRALGEQPRGVSSAWWFVLLIAAAVVVYFIIQRTG